MTSRINAPCILHICRDTSKIIEDIPKTGVSAFHIDPKTNLQTAREKVRNIPLAGE
ncbi:MAG: uroporphyrinogen decarboxylase family protein [Thermoproteota archaeon]